MPPQSALPLQPFATPPMRVHLPWAVPGVQGGQVTPSGHGGQSVPGARSQKEPGSHIVLLVQSKSG